MKSQKRVNGIPVILMYKRGNTTIIPDDSVTGSDPTQLHNFFRRCGNHLVEVEKKFAQTVQETKEEKLEKKD
jgi:hypothetical protein